MKLKLLKLIRLFHLINKEEYNEKRQIEIVKSSSLFDAKWYLEQYPDVKEKNIGAARHYVRYGWKEGRNPSTKFDNKAYLRKFPELYELNVCPLFHKIKQSSNKVNVILNFIKNIFSIKKVYCNYKQLTILGFKYKWLFNDVYKNVQVKEKTICINNFQGNLYGCNPKYIAEEIIKRKLPYKIKWMAKEQNIKNIKKIFPKEIKVVDYDAKELSSAQLVISNVHLNPLIKEGWIKKKKQYYLQTWHGSLGIKKLDASVKKLKFDKGDFTEIGQIDAEYTDLFVSNSDFESNVYNDGLWANNRIVMLGHPRNDVFFYSDEKKNVIFKRVQQYFKNVKNKKILLYIPTFRDNFNLDCYNLNVNLILNSLKERFGNEWCLLVRMHPNLKKFSNELFNFSDNVMDASFYPDIQELLATADVAISDYSSCIFDFMLQRKPAFIFASDQEDYDQDRGFYYPLTATPFPVAEDNEELSRNIAEFDDVIYQKKIDEFLKDKGCMEDGHASERVVDLIEKIMNGEINE